MSIPNSTRRPSHAMVLAAGRGERMRPITDKMPKPLIQVGGESLIDRALDKLIEAGVEKAVVNVHHLADLLINHLSNRKRPEIIISDERLELLDTGGGVVNALPLLGDAPFFLMNSDTFWIEDGRSNLERMSAVFDQNKMDALLLLVHFSKTSGLEGRRGKGFLMDSDGKLQRSPDRSPDSYIYAGAAITARTFFAGMPQTAFPLSKLFDRSASTGRLFGTELHGTWVHVGRPEMIPVADALLK